MNLKILYIIYFQLIIKFIALLTMSLQLPFKMDDFLFNMYYLFFRALYIEGRKQNFDIFQFMRIVPHETSNRFLELEFLVKKTSEFYSCVTGISIVIEWNPWILKHEYHIYLLGRRNDVNPEDDYEHYIFDDVKVIIKEWMKWMGEWKDV